VGESERGTREAYLLRAYEIVKANKSKTCPLKPGDPRRARGVSASSNASTFLAQKELMFPCESKVGIKTDVCCQEEVFLLLQGGAAFYSTWAFH
jgi:hypothetical protein